jgi:P2X purinoceptor 4
MLNLAGVPSIQNIATNGTVIAFLIEYDCNLDKSISLCIPKVSFLRIDDPTSSSSGFNFRYTTKYYMQNNQSEFIRTRDLTKTWGVRFVFLVSGVGAKFDSPVPFFTALGAGVGILAIATVITDSILIYILPKRKYYKENKIEEIEDASSAIQTQAENTKLLFED